MGVRIYKIIGFLMILSAICRCRLPISRILNGWNLHGYGYTEFLINFEGGFVRRGLLGEVLLWITERTGVHPYILITTLSLLAFGFVLCFFIRKFKDKGYCWWIIFSPLLCGYMLDIIRKDFILYAITICMFLLVRHSHPAMWKKLLAFTLALLGLLLHEAFIFWGIPLFALVLLNDRPHRVANIIMLVCLLSAFGVLCFFKGDASIAQSIIDSWNNILPDSPLKPMYGDSIGALTWNTKETMMLHLALNVGRSQLCLGIVYWPLLYFAAYYLITFFHTVFQPKRTSFGVTKQTTLSSMFLIVSFCLLPMFTVLSCDYARLYQYAAMTAFAAFFILDGPVKKQIVPKAIQSRVARFNDFLARTISPSKGLLVLLLFTIGMCPASLNMYESLLQSPVGALWEGLWFALYYAQVFFSALI